MYACNSPNSLSPTTVTPENVPGVPTEAGRITLLGQCLASEAEIAALDPDADDHALTTLPGSYTSIVTSAETTTIRSDLTGQFPVYYSLDSGTASYARDPRELTGGSREVDRIALAKHIIGAGFVAPERTAWQGISRLLPAHKLTIARSGMSIEEYDSLAPDSSVTFTAAAAELRGHLEEALAARMRLGRQVGVDFSGGLDSTSLAFLGSTFLGNDEHLEAFHFRHEGMASGDFPYALSYAELDKRIRLHTVSAGKDVLPYSSLDTVGNSALPTDLVATMASLGHHLQAVANHDVSLHIVGDGGDELFDPPAEYLIDLLSTDALRHLPRIINRTLLSAQHGFKSPVGVLKALHAATQIGPQHALEELAKAVISGERASTGWFAVDFSSVNFLSSDIRQELGSIMAEMAESIGPSDELGRAGLMTSQSLYAAGKSISQLREVAASYGIDIHAPYLDHQVIRSSLRLAPHRRTNPMQFKALLRSAMEGLVPPQVFERRTKGGGDTSHYHGIRANASSLRSLLGQKSCLATLGIIDLTSIERAIADAEFGRAAPLNGILRAASIEIWLRQQGFSGSEDSVAAPPPNRTPPSPVMKTSRIPSVYVPEHVRFVHDAAGGIALNMESGTDVSLHVKAMTILKFLQRTGDIHHTVDALARQYPDTKPSRLRESVAGIVGNLITAGVLEEGTEHIPFTINTATGEVVDMAGDTPVLRGFIQKKGLYLNDYVRIGRTLRDAARLVTDMSLFGLVQHLREQKEGLPAADPGQVERLLRAGHILNRFYPERIACLELSTAVVLAEAKAGRAVTINIGTAPDPRRYHAWPAIQGRPVQTAWDEVIEGNYTAFGTW